MKKILIAGDIMLDLYRYGRVDRISPEAPVPIFCETGKEKYVPGGAANVAVNIASIGIETELCAVVGKDDNGKKLLELLQEKGVSIASVSIDTSRSTTMKQRYIGLNNQQIFRVDIEDIVPLPFYLIQDILVKIKENISQYGLFVLSDYNKGYLTKEITQFFITLGRKNNIPVLVDVKDKNLEKYKNADLLKPNRKELAILTDLPVYTKEEVIKAAVNLCHKASSTYVLATLGADGMILVDKTGVVQEVKSTASEVYDVTGAGDTSLAYLAAKLIEGKNMLEAVIVANYAAGIQISKMGTSIVYPDEVDAVMQKERRWKIKKQLDFYKESGLSILKKEKKFGKKIVFTNGCFDILHAGHVFYLKKAKELGDILVVGVNSDLSVKRLKGEERPINPLAERMFILSALEVVDYVISFNEDTPEELIAEIIPDVLVKGGDYQVDNIVGADIVLEHGGEVHVQPYIEGKSTTAILKKIL